MTGGFGEDSAAPAAGRAEIGGAKLRDIQANRKRKLADDRTKRRTMNGIITNWMARETGVFAGVEVRGKEIFLRG